jgi:hypothetical protein
MEQILSDHAASTSFDRLVKAGFHKDLLEGLLVRFANARLGPIQLIPGKSRKAIEGLIDRTLSLAAEIEAANASLYFDPSLFAFPSGLGLLKDKPPLNPVYLELPFNLRLYCGHLTIQMRMHRRLTNERGMLKTGLVVLARRFTGEPHFEKLAELLTAAFHAAGGSENKIVSANSLLQLEKDHEAAISCVRQEFEKNGL